MTRFRTWARRILGIFGALVLVAVLTLGIVVSHNSACEPGDPLPGGTTSMMAIAYRCYGSPEVLTLEERARPSPAADEVLVKVHAAAVNPLDWHYMRGSPYLMRLSSGIGAPKDPRMGVDFAGTVEAVGESVTKFKPGDAVFGGKTGAFAEYLTVREDRAVTLKPDNVTFEQAAAVPIAAITALQALRDKGHVQPGQKVLINGASGGVGTYAVQIAKSYGAEVTGVCSTRNVDLVRSIGADHVIDYTKENFTERDERYDVILDNVGNHSLLKLRHVLKPKGTIVMVGGPKGDWVGPLARPINALLVSPFVDEKFLMILAEFNQADMDVLGELMRTGKMTSVIDRQYTLREVPAAIGYVEEGRARGKVVINMEAQTASAAPNS
jgi:NADPH:quinone reductase-like Zn-dependent oxidoreductase